ATRLFRMLGLPRRKPDQPLASPALLPTTPPEPEPEPEPDAELIVGEEAHWRPELPPAVVRSAGGPQASIQLGDLTVWIWLGLLLFRGSWAVWFELQILPAWVPEVMRHVLGALLLAPLLVWWRRQNASPRP
ncbi:MAG: hypothetical protein KDA45_14465, partial [Planctomycetales bacterium]|nr:hypothetical protein [Planctomycetales bacterium]